MDFGYPGDSFHTLTGPEQVGLVALSLSLWAGLAALLWRWPRVWLALALLWLFAWLSPQVYYLYYLLIFDGLPVQLVIGTPPGPLQIGRLLLFSGADTLSAHGKGVLGWSLIGLAAWRQWHHRRTAT